MGKVSSKACCRRFLEFLRAGGNVLPMTIRDGSGCTLRKDYEGYDRRGEGLGRPHLMITIDTRRANEAAALLGAQTMPSREGRVYVLEAETAAVLPDGRRIDRYRGVRSGLYNVQSEHGHAVRLSDGRFVHAPTERGVRRKLAAEMG